MLLFCTDMAAEGMHRWNGGGFPHTGIKASSCFSVLNFFLKQVKMYFSRSYNSPETSFYYEW